MIHFSRKRIFFGPNLDYRQRARVVGFVTLGSEVMGSNLLLVQFFASEFFTTDLLITQISLKEFI